MICPLEAEFLEPAKPIGQKPSQNNGLARIADKFARKIAGGFVTDSDFHRLTFWPRGWFLTALWRLRPADHVILLAIWP